MKKGYSFIIGETFVNLTNVDTGNSVTITDGDARFKDVLTMIRDRKFEEAERLLDVKVAVEEFASASKSHNDFSVTLEGRSLFYTYKGGEKKEINNAIVSRIVNMASMGIDPTPLCNFMANLLSNPTKSAVDEMYLFIEACQLPITDDGCFIAYKIVRDDYMDIYTGKTCRHMIGDKPEMPRFEVDSDRNRTCSAGLHFCSKAYLPKYGSNDRSSDRVVLVKINPADVVAIPSDYNNSKGRAWRYEVVGEVKDSNWRDTLSTKDYTDSQVVSSQNPMAPVKKGTGKFKFDVACNRWKNTETNGFVSRTFVASETGLSVEEVQRIADLAKENV